MQIFVYKTSDSSFYKSYMEFFAWMSDVAIY